MSKCFRCRAVVPPGLVGSTIASDGSAVCSRLCALATQPVGEPVGQTRLTRLISGRTLTAAELGRRLAEPTLQLTPAEWRSVAKVLDDYYPGTVFTRGRYTHPHAAAWHALQTRADVPVDVQTRAALYTQLMLHIEPIDGRLDQAKSERHRTLLRDIARLLAAHDQDAQANYRRTAALRGADARAYAEWKASIAQTVDAERPCAVRWQMQTPLVGPSLLTVFSTAVYDRLLQRAVHPVHGLSAVWRRPVSSPLTLPPAMQRVDGHRSVTIVNELLAYVYGVHALLGRGGTYAVAAHPMSAGLRAENLDAGALDTFVRHVHANWAAYGLPAVRAEVRLLQPNAQPGDVLIWNGFHGSAAVAGRATPHLVMFHDFMPRETLDTTTRAHLFRLQERRPVEFGSGNKASRSEAWNTVYNAARGFGDGGLARLGAGKTMLAEYLAGNDEAEPAALGAALTAVVSDDDKAQLVRQGYLIVPRATLDAASGGQWSRDIERVIDELQDYMSWALLEEQNTPSPPFQLRAADDPRWRALSGRGKDAKAIFDDELWLRLFMPDRVTKAGTAQSGGARLSGDSGMGPALNAYDLPAQQALRTSPALFSLAAALYGTRRLMAVNERFRLKVAAKVFAVHTDRLIAQLPPDAVAMGDEIEYVPLGHGIEFRPLPDLMPDAGAANVPAGVLRDQERFLAWRGIYGPGTFLLVMHDGHGFLSTDAASPSWIDRGDGIILGGFYDSRADLAADLPPGYVFADGKLTAPAKRGHLTFDYQRTIFPNNRSTPEYRVVVCTLHDLA